MGHKPTGASIWMIGASLAFALMAACIKLATRHEAPVAQILFYRGAVSLIAIGVVLRIVGLPAGSPHWKAHVKRSLWSYAGMVAFFTAISRLPLATAVTLNYTSSLWLGVILSARPGEHASRPLLGVTLAGFAGVGLMLRPTLDTTQWSAALIGLASGVTGALAALNVRDIGRLNEPPLRTVFYFSLFVAAVSTPGFSLESPVVRESRGGLVRDRRGVICGGRSDWHHARLPARAHAAGFALGLHAGRFHDPVGHPPLGGSVAPDLVAGNAHHPPERRDCDTAAAHTIDPGLLSGEFVSRGRVAGLTGPKLVPTIAREFFKRRSTM